MCVRVSSFGDISGATILGDVNLLTAGVIVVFLYVQLMLGKFNMVEQRVNRYFSKCYIEENGLKSTWISFDFRLSCR